MRIQEIDTKVDKLFIAQLVLISFWYIFFFIGLYMLKKVIDFRGFRRILNAMQENIRWEWGKTVCVAWLTWPRNVEN